MMQQRMAKACAATAFTALGCVSAVAAVSVTSLGTTYTENFDTLAASGTSTALPSGWAFVESGTNANTVYTAGTGSSNTGDTYSYGAGSSSERALGGLRSGTLVPSFGVGFINHTGAVITSLEVGYFGEQWRLGQNTEGRAADRLDFQFSTDATSLESGVWTDHDALDFSSPVVAGTVGALSRNANRTARSLTLGGLNIADGQEFWMRWQDADLSPGADDGLAIDDFALTARGSTVTPVPEPGSLALVGLALAGLCVRGRRTR
jgi:hypothetical protein